MSSQELENRRVFLVASDNSANNDYFSNVIRQHIANATVYTAHDGQDALFKFDNDPPDVVILDTQLSKFNSIQVAEKVLNHEKLKHISLIIVSDLPDTDHVVTCQVQFLTTPQNEKTLIQCLTRGLNRLSLHDDSSYSLRFLAPDEILFKEGERVASVFILKHGKMQVLKNSDNNMPVVLGEIKEGEFVGEMAHFIGGVRSATVQATSDCELIEIPEGVLDSVLFSKPAWAKALVASLSRRLKHTNEVIAQKKLRPLLKESES